ncbi:MAG TPA: type II secretion system protein [Candidatus Polarisedimenticolia bacterium]|nr:type II secretion system protein [Candidatus Polarisedimenticolia bacterium]
MRPYSAQHAFTLIELLVVIAIIGILASLSAVAISRIRVHGQVVDAQRQMHQLLNAIVEYHSDTGAYPVSDGVKGAAIASQGDFTCGGSALDAVFGGPGAWSTNNSEIIAILMGLERYPNTGGPTANFGHVKNTRQKRYLTANMTGGTDSPGVGQDLVYRDPWGNPYVISIDLNYDEKCRDAFYQKSVVSRDVNAIGFYGLFNSSDTSGNSDQFEYRGGVMIWSLGPDKRAALDHANAGANRDNVLIWR